MTHKLTSSFVLGYHGCDAKVAERLLSGEDFKPSQNDYDWLGPGIYFWEANPKRGLEFAKELKGRKRSKVTNPAVVGAVIELGLCLDLTTSAGTNQVKEAHDRFIEIATKGELPLPTNSNDLMRRNLDCAVIRFFHEIRNEQEDPPVDTVRGVFIEGEPVYEGAGFHEKTHIQICVCNAECIKGIFRVPAAQLA